jgi:hypothetical protein
MTNVFIYGKTSDAVDRCLPNIEKSNVLSIEEVKDALASSKSLTIACPVALLSDDLVRCVNRTSRETGARVGLLPFHDENIDALRRLLVSSEGTRESEARIAVHSIVGLKGDFPQEDRTLIQLVDNDFWPRVKQGDWTTLVAQNAPIVGTQPGKP